MGRKTDSGEHTSTRSTRMYEQAGNWYFNTREGTVVGPFTEELEAYTQLEVYIRLADSDMLPAGQDDEPSLLKAATAG